MPDMPSRRDILIGGVAASLSIPSIVNAQTTPTSPTQPEDREAALLARAKKASDGNSLERKKYVLKENSEPCFTYIPEPRQVRAR